MEPGGEDHGGRRPIHVNPDGGTMAKRILSLFRNLFRKHAIERALDELRSTLEALMQEKTEQGLSQSAARREALIEIGGIQQVKERVRAVRAGTSW
jgi:hypothetical protein